MQFFNRVKFRTPESVELEFTLAGIGNRAWALLIDYFVLAVILLVCIYTWISISGQLADIFQDQDTIGSQVGLWLIAITFLLLFGIYVGYFVFFETIWQGQTPGKRFAKIRVVRDDGRPVGLAQATLRALLRPLDEFLFLGSFLIMFSHREKRLGDWAAGTIVIEAERAIASATFTISEQAKSLYTELLSIAELSQLLPDDFAIIREYLQRRGAMAAKSRVALASKLSQQVAAIINLEQLPEVPPDIFLEAIYLAYQHKEF
ncbi:RDD domain-containing protein [Anabaenopsis circularis NIES-21]|uniref:RDD domain-containing protein n=1 Tax=Anabaenopsis circularis NIES-21 TaxID=1085406 RepID=A0A1Z4GEQ3_9CYAN|nr:RDD domain-containing protein [Anabaenopsis circularis NIES-21]